MGVGLGCRRFCWWVHKRINACKIIQKRSENALTTKPWSPWKGKVSDRSPSRFPLQGGTGRFRLGPETNGIPELYENFPSADFPAHGFAPRITTAAGRFRQGVQLRKASFAQSVESCRLEALGDGVDGLNHQGDVGSSRRNRVVLLAKMETQLAMCPCRRRDATEIVAEYSKQPAPGHVHRLAVEGAGQGAHGLVFADFDLEVCECCDHGFESN
jgi:hypothetical protein